MPGSRQAVPECRPEETGRLSQREDRATDAQLVERARSGDERAFRDLVERYEGRVASTVIGMLGPGDEAEDVGQETFIRLYRSLDRFRGDASLGTYLTRIAINLSLTALKRRKRFRARFVSRDDDGRATPEPGVDPEPAIERKEVGHRVRKAVDELSPDHRAVVVLRMIDGYSTREAARILGVPAGTVMSRLARALERLEEKMEAFRDE